MLCVISPAKKLNETPRELPDGQPLTEPAFAAEADALAAIARGLSVADLRRLMDISEPLARLNLQRFAALARPPAPGEVLPAIHCFAGDTYQGLRAQALSARGLARAGERLRILSGLYGLLRPFDGIRAYRLEMGSRLANPAGPDLYAFWADRIAMALNAAAEAAGTGWLVNCASVEYFTAAARPSLALRVVTPVFLDGPPGAERVVSFHAKRARGALARFLCEHDIDRPEDLHAFAEAGYAWRKDLSAPDRPVFLRPAEAPAAGGRSEAA